MPYKRCLKMQVKDLNDHAFISYLAVKNRAPSSRSEDTWTIEDYRTKFQRDN